MLCVLCLIVLWGFSLVTSYSGVKQLDKMKHMSALGVCVAVLHICFLASAEASAASVAAANRARVLFVPYAYGERACKCSCYIQSPRRAPPP